MGAELMVLNPVAEVKRESVELAPRLNDINGKTIALYWNGKAGGDILLEHSAQLLKQRYSGVKFKNYLGVVGQVMRHATAEQAEAIAKECDALIATTAD